MNLDEIIQILKIASGVVHPNYNPNRGKVFLGGYFWTP